MKFAHLGDCHLGGWRQPELKELNLKSFQEAVRRCIKNKADFILISGDLFDSAYPPIEVLKTVFEEFRRLKEAKIPVFLIAGSHDYSVSGKTFLDVLEKAGFCQNVSVFKEREGKLILEPTLYQNVAIYGYPGKKSGLEVEEIEKIRIQDSPGLFKILMLHTTLKDAIGELPIKAVNDELLPNVDYVALGHLHIHYYKDRKAYSGPTFPNTLSELEELKYGSFILFENKKVKREEIRLKDVFSLNLEINNALTATENILSLIRNENIQDKIVIIRVSGILEKGKISDIDFQKIEEEVRKRGAFTMLKSTSKLHIAEPEVYREIFSSENIESQIIKRFEEKNPSKFNYLITRLFGSLQIEKLEDEASFTFEERLLSELTDVINLENQSGLKNEKYAIQKD